MRGKRWTSKLGGTVLLIYCYNLSLSVFMKRRAILPLVYTYDLNHHWQLFGFKVS